MQSARYLKNAPRLKNEGPVLFALDFSHRGGGFRFPFVDILIKHGEGDKENDTDNVFNPFDMRIEINQGVQRLNHAAGQQILVNKLCYLPVGPLQTAYQRGHSPGEKQGSGRH